MNTTIKDKQLELLIDLQEIAKEIQKLNQLKERIPQEIENERQIYEKIKKEANQLKETIENEKKEQRNKELETLSAKDNLINTKEKLPNLKTNKEYAALVQEIENLKKKIYTLEDGELELMESIEKNQKDYERKLKEQEMEEQKFLEIKKRKEEDLKKLNKLLEEELNQKNELAERIETKWLTHYEKLLAVRKRLVVVPIDKETCGGCHCSLMPQLSLEVRRNDSVITCPHCSRFLFSEQATGVD